MMKPLVLFVTLALLSCSAACSRLRYKQLREAANPVVVKEQDLGVGSGGGGDAGSDLPTSLAELMQGGDAAKIRMALALIRKHASECEGDPSFMLRCVAEQPEAVQKRFMQEMRSEGIVEGTLARSGEDGDVSAIDDRKRCMREVAKELSARAKRLKLKGPYVNIDDYAMTFALLFEQSFIQVDLRLPPDANPRLVVELWVVVGAPDERRVSVPEIFSSVEAQVQQCP